jgi:secreted trypsin-like serine protease
MCRTALLALLLLAWSVPAWALYGGSEVPAAEGEAAVFFDWRAPRGSGSCSGVLVADRAVLTAAHCIQSVTFGMQRVRAVRVGNPRGRTQRATVERAVAHPEFDVAHPERGHDVAVLLLSKAVTGRARVRLATRADDPTEQGTRLLVTGFGLTRRGRQTVRSRALRGASLEYLSPFHCFSGDVARMATTRMCAASGDAGVCPGDSGSPAMLQIGGAPVVVGIVSLAIDARTCSETAAVLTRVSAMRDWITTVISAPP